MREPASCALWSEPERVLDRSLRDGFRLLDTFVQDDHFSRRLLACRECGQRYVFEFYEEVDWAGGDDPQYCTWIPVETDAEVRELCRADRLEFAGYRPCLRKDWPKEAPRPTAYWLRAAAEA